MTIDEIKSVSIYQWMQENNYGSGTKRGKNVFYNSPLRSESDPSFVVNTKDNLWHDFGSRDGGNLINLVEKLNPSWSEHQVLSYLENQIREKNLQFNEDIIMHESKKKKRRSSNGSKVNVQNEKNSSIRKLIAFCKGYILQRVARYNLSTCPSMTNAKKSNC